MSEDGVKIELNPEIAIVLIARSYDTNGQLLLISTQLVEFIGFLVFKWKQDLFVGKHRIIDFHVEHAHKESFVDLGISHQTHTSL